MRGAIRGTVIYLMWASLAAVVAIARNLPAGFAGAHTGLSAAHDFLVGMGTALSPPLWWMAAQAACVAVAARRTSAHRGLTAALIFFGVSEFVGALGEPITMRVFRPQTFDPLLATVQSGMILLPLAVIVAGIGALRKARTSTAHAAMT